MGVPIEIRFIASGCALVPALYAWICRKSISDWALAFGMLVFTLESLLGGLAEKALTLSKAIELTRWESASTALLPGAWILFSLTHARGNRSQFLHRSRLLLGIAFLAPLGVAAVGWTSLIGFNGEAVELGWSGRLLALFVLLGSIVVLANLERTYRASVGTLRWRIKFTLIGIGLIFLVRIYTSSQALLFKGEDPTLAFVNAAALAVSIPLLLRGYFRQDRFIAEVYPSYTVLRGSLTILLAGIYLLVVGVGAKTLAKLGGGAVFAYEALFLLMALVAAVLLLQSDRLRLRLGQWVGHHFRRPVYDYREVWGMFIRGTAQTRDEIELSRSLVKITAELFQSLSVTLWLFEDSALTFAASTSLSTAQGRELGPNPAETAALRSFFEEHSDPLSLAGTLPAEISVMNRMQPSEFVHRRNRVAVPIVDHGRVVALMSIGDRVGGLAFGPQDFEMLRCVAAHAAANLVNARLSQRLIVAKEVEAFQTMAAFFVHDLKNAASAFRLMLNNLPLHWDDPDFRKDALKSVSAAVTHIEHLIGRLGLFRTELKMNPTECDLNDVVKKALCGLDADPSFTIARDLAHLPPSPIDGEQFGKVVTNLVLNAKEAMDGHGEIALSTASKGDWNILTVRDRGCGMSDEFISRSLYRPFQSTKKSGLGIGMFQSKRIVEIHGGRISVKSAPGQGTTFEVMVPVATSRG